MLKKSLQILPVIFLFLVLIVIAGMLSSCYAADGETINAGMQMFGDLVAIFIVIGIPVIIIIIYFRKKNTTSNPVPQVAPTPQRSFVRIACSNCGTINETGANFCEKCGNPINN